MPSPPAGEDAAPSAGSSWEQALAMIPDADGDDGDGQPDATWDSIVDEIPDAVGTSEEEPTDEACSSLDALVGLIPDASDDEMGTEGVVARASDGSDSPSAEMPVAIIHIDQGLNDCMVQLFHCAARIPDDALDASTMALCEALLQAEVGVTNTTQEARRFDAPRDAVRERYLLLAATALQLERQQWQHMERSVAASRGQDVELLMYIDCASYDSADFSLKSKQVIDEQVACDVGAAEEPGPDGGQQAPIEVIRLTEVVSGKKKVLQVETSALMLLRVNGRLVVIRGNVLTWLQICDRNSSECYKAALESQWSGTASANEFSMKLRLACTDGAGSIGKAERHIVANRPEWQSLHFHCRVHMLYNVLTRVYDLREQDISGLLAVALALGAPGQIGTFRAALRRVIARKLRIVTAVVLDEAARKYRQLVVRAFGLDKPEHAALRLVVERCAGGDWRDGEHFYYLAAPGESRTEVLRELFEVFVPFLFGHCPRIFPRSRWTGALQCLRDIGLPLVIHQLLPDAFKEYLAAIRDPQHISALIPANNMGSQADELAGAPPGDAGQLALVPLDAPSFEEQSRALPQPAVDAATADENKANRGAAMAWLRTDPGDFVVYFALLMDPLMSFMGSELDASSGEFETRESFKQMSVGPNLDSLIGGRQWPLLLCAQQVHEKRCMNTLQELGDTIPCASLRPAHLNLHFESVVSKMFSRAGCVLYDHFIDRFSKFPFRLFLLLVDPALEGDILSSCEQSWDDFSADFIRRHKPNLRSEVALAELSLIAMVARVTTVLLECRNAQIRRYVESLSVHTAAPSSELVSAKFLLRKLSLREQMVKEPPGFKLVRKKISKDKAGRSRASESSGKSSAPKGHERHGGGGPWRAFVSERCRGVAAAVFKALSQEYHALPADEKQRLKDIGNLGTIAHREGGVSFGVMAGRFGKAMARDATHRRALEVAQCNVLDSAMVASKALALRTADIRSAARACKLDFRLLQRIKRQQTHAAANAIARWRSSAGVALRDGLLALVPGLASLTPGLVGQPHGGGALVLDWICPARRMLPRMVAALQLPGNSCVADTLLKDWSDKHTEWKHASQPPLPPPPRRRSAAMPSCCEAGVCLHGESGARMFKFKSWFETCLKASTKQPELRAKLGNCCIVVRLRHLGDPPDDGDAQDSCGEEQRVLLEKYLLVGLMYWSPYKPTLRSCIKEMGAPSDIMGHVHLKCQHHYLGVFNLAEELKPQLQAGEWEFKCFEVCADQRPISRVDPRHMIVKEIRGSEVMRRSFEQRRRVRRSVRPADGWFAALDDLDDVESVDSADGEDPGEEPISEAQSAGGSPPEVSGDERSSLASSQESLAPSPVGDDGVELGQAEAQEQPASPELSPAHSIDDMMVDVVALQGDGGAGRGDGNREEGLAPDDEAAAASSDGGGGAIGELPPALPPVAAARQPPEGLDAGDVVAHTAFGVIRYYNNRQEFVAHCSNPQHGQQCRLSRSAKPSLAAHRAGQGRPIGLLAAWLAVSFEEELPNKAAHVRLQPLPELSARQAARAALAGSPGSAGLLSKERPVRRGEPDEPEFVP